MREEAGETLLFFNPNVGPPVVPTPAPQTSAPAPVLTQMTSSDPSPHFAPPAPSPLHSTTPAGYVNIAPLLDISSRMAAKVAEFQELVEKVCEFVSELNRLANPQHQSGALGHNPPPSSVPASGNDNCFIAPSLPQSFKAQTDSLRPAHQPPDRRDLLHDHRSISQQQQQPYTHRLQPQQQTHDHLQSLQMQGYAASGDHLHAPVDSHDHHKS
eukprot:c14446_g1_i3.p1 GENE.c14446_g1_i3~~c14446_g1_i3.p1  ORF type:complete len:213 (-),score=30.50 c14446_g1_i3:7-645(-)